MHHLNPEDVPETVSDIDSNNIGNSSSSSDSDDSSSYSPISLPRFTMVSHMGSILNYPYRTGDERIHIVHLDEDCCMYTRRRGSDSSSEEVVVEHTTAVGEILCPSRVHWACRCDAQTHQRCIMCYKCQGLYHPGCVGLDPQCVPIEWKCTHCV